MVAKFQKTDSLVDLQKFISDVYRESGDKHFSLFELVAQQERFSMRILKRIRKKDMPELASDLAVALSWAVAVANRLHLDIGDALWKRFPGVCSYCSKRPCGCSVRHLTGRAKVSPASGVKKPQTLERAQAELAEIYPKEKRTIESAGMLLAEEMGEFSEAINQYYLTHKDAEYEKTQKELADYVSCIFDVANSAGISLADVFAQLYEKNCHLCHNLPCTCDYSKASFVI